MHDENLRLKANYFFFSMLFCLIAWSENGTEHPTTLLCEDFRRLIAVCIEMKVPGRVCDQVLASDKHVILSFPHGFAFYAVDSPVDCKL